MDIRECYNGGDVWVFFLGMLMWFVREDVGGGISLFMVDTYKTLGVIYIFCFIQPCSMNVIVLYISFTVRYLFEHAPCNIWAIRVTVF
jgi:hypothetical protein